MRGECYFYLFMVNTELKYIKRTHWVIDTLQRRVVFHSFASANQKFATKASCAITPVTISKNELFLAHITEHQCTPGPLGSFLCLRKEKEI